MLLRFPDLDKRERRLSEKDTNEQVVLLASAVTITPALAGSLLAANPQGLWLLLALLMVGAAALIVLLERGLPEAALRTARGATTAMAQQEAGDLECPEPCVPRQLRGE